MRPRGREGERERDGPRVRERIKNICKRESGMKIYVSEGRAEKEREEGRKGGRDGGREEREGEEREVSLSLSLSLALSPSLSLALALALAGWLASYLTTYQPTSPHLFLTCVYLCFCFVSTLCARMAETLVSAIEKNARNVCCCVREREGGRDGERKRGGHSIKLILNAVCLDLTSFLFGRCQVATAI